MKVFVVKKEIYAQNDEYIHREEVNIREEEKFNYIIIKNPSDSNRVYTFSTVYMSNESEDNEACIMVGEEDMYDDVEGKLIQCQSDNFELKVKSVANKCLNKLEVCTQKIFIDKPCDILKDKSLVILPKGCLFIRFKKQINKLNFIINWTSENIN